MRENTEKTYPYARVKALRELFDFVKEPNWNPGRVDADLLKKLAIAPSKERVTFNTLVFLGVVDDDGRPTDVFFDLKSDFSGTLNRVILEAYRELFALVPASLMNQERLIRFFGTARDTAEYQAKLFVYLCGEGEIHLPNVDSEFHRSRHDRH